MQLRLFLYLSLTCITFLLYASDDFTGTELLCRPTDKSITVSIVPAVDMEYSYEYGRKSGEYDETTKAVEAKASEPSNFLIDGLTPDTRYYYRLSYHIKGKSETIKREEHSFHTQRESGETFLFAVESDSHLGARICNPELFKQTLLNIRSEEPDFLLDLDDAFCSSHLNGTLLYQKIMSQYIKQRPYLGIPCSSVPLFLVQGNHESEAGWINDGSAGCRPVISTLIRKIYYPNPEPDAFYSGDSVKEKYVGLREDYYAWQWGDALFVTLDPWWYTYGSDGDIDHGPKDLWRFTIGDEQYKWFKKTLEQSRARYKFVFSHHAGGASRGGIEVARYYEWGGLDKDGKWEFDKMRPGWESPIHQLMVKNRVTIFFQGHDHLFATQRLDGIVYQTCPMASAPSYYGHGKYLSGDIFPSSGHLLVKVSPSGVKVDYVRSFLPDEKNRNQKNGQIDYSYTVNDMGDFKIDYCSPSVVHNTDTLSSD